MGLQFIIQYKAGLTNKAADALSRRGHADDAEVAALSFCKPTWLEAVKNSYLNNAGVTARMEKLALDPNSEPHYTMKDGILRYKGRVWTGNDAMVQQHLINSLHSSAVGGHSGFHATYNRIKRLFAWHGMKAQIKQSVRTCMICQQAKTERKSLAGLLQPLPIPKRPCIGFYGLYRRTAAFWWI